MKLNLKIWIVNILIAGMSFASCDSYFDVETDDMLDASDNYKEKETIYASLLGVADIFREVAEHNIILSELLGDLMIPTNNAPDECWDIYRLKATNGNSFASPQPYYRLILECNELLRNTILYNKNYPGSLATNAYQGVISSAITYRVWAYLQLGKLYGEAVYHDNIFVDDNGMIPGSNNLLKLEQLIPELIHHLKIGLDGVDGFKKLDWKIIINPLGEDYDFDKTWNYIAIDANVLLTELYLWDKDYANAVTTGLEYLDAVGDKYKLDVFTMYNGSSQWFKLFYEEKMNDSHFKELCTLIPYNFNRQQTSKMQYYFSDMAPNVYYFTPHMNTLMRFVSQVSGVIEDEDPELDGLLMRSEDPRMLASINAEIDGSYGKLVVSKYHLNKDNYEQDAPVYVYRAPEIYLMIAEGLSALNNIAAADSIINVGFKSSWENDHFKPPFSAPVYGSTLQKCTGIRGRFAGSIASDYVRYHVDTIAYPDSTATLKMLKQQREKFVVDSLICEETALELAYEGKRWFTLMRIARNSEKPELLAKQISAKFDIGERQLYENWLMDPNNWYIKWDQMNVLNQDKNEKNEGI